MAGVVPSTWLASTSASKRARNMAYHRRSGHLLLRFPRLCALSPFLLPALFPPCHPLFYPMSAVTIRVELPSFAHSFQIQADASWSIKDVKAEIQRSCTGTPRADGQRLIWRGRFLKDEEYVKDIWKVYLSLVVGSDVGSTTNRNSTVSRRCVHRSSLCASFRLDKHSADTTASHSTCVFASRPAAGTISAAVAASSSTDGRPAGFTKRTKSVATTRNLAPRVYRE